MGLYRSLDAQTRLGGLRSWYATVPNQKQGNKDGKKTFNGDKGLTSYSGVECCSLNGARSQS